MQSFLKLFLALAVLVFPGWNAAASDDRDDVFVPISKYLSQGNAEALSAWFDDNLDISVISNGGTCSKSQAKQILKSFFESYSPRSFEITHTSGRANMKYALGNLSAGGETFSVTIFVSRQKDKYLIQQLVIERR